MSDIDQRAPRDDTPHPADEQRAPAKRANDVQLFQEPSRAVSQTNEVSSSALAERARSEIQARTIVAMNRPRNLNTVRLNILQACKRPVFAETARYSKPMGGKQVTGLSIRFAEECARHYQNLDINSFLISEDNDRRTFECVAVDLETNVRFAAPVIVPKTVWRKNPKGAEVLGQKLNSSNEMTYRIAADEDSLLVLQSNMLAKAQREVILKHIPSDIKEEAEDQIIDTAKSRDAADPQAAAKKIFDSFFELGVMPEQIEAFLGHTAKTINPAELTLLRGLYRGIKDEGATWADIVEAKRGDVAGTTEPTPTTGTGAGARLKATAAKAAAKTEAAPEAPKDKVACRVCHRSDGTHDPNAPCYAD